MANKDGVLSIGIEYKAELNKMIADLEGGLDTISKNNQLSKGMKQQFDNVIAEVRNFKATMEKELATLGSGKVDKTAFKSFKQTVANNFKTVREDIDRLDLAVSTLNSQMEIISKGVDLSKISKEFANFQDYVNRTNDAVSQLIDTLDQQGISLFSFDNRNILDTKNKIKEIDNIINQLDTDKGVKFELFDEKEAQSELDRLSVQLRSTLELMEHTEKQISNMDNSTVGFKKMQGDFALLQLKAASLNDTIEMLYTVTEDKGISIEMDDKSFELYDKYTEDLSDNLESIISSAKNAKKELSTLLESQKQPTVKVSSEMNPNSSELATTVTIETTSSELWKKLSPILTDLQGILNSNPVVAPVKLVVAPNAVSSTENGDVGKVSSAYSKKYAKVLAETSEDAVIDLEGVYKKTFTSIMDAGVSYAKKTIGKIQDIFDKSPINIKYIVSQEEIDKIQNFVLSNKDGKKVDISGQITKAKQEVEELNTNIEKTSSLLQNAQSKGNVKFDGFDKFTDDLSKSIGKLEELQNILKALQNIEITLAKASGLSSITEIENQWESLEKRIINATKLDGSFRKNASINKIASEYQKYIDMGGTNTLSDISKIQENKDTIDTIISKAKEFQKQDFTNDSVEKLSVDLDGVIDKFNELINTVKTATNALYKIIRDGNVSDLDKQWSSISNKFKSIADESGKINLSKQKTDIKELMEMYQKYLNAGGMKSPFDLTDNTVTLAKLNKVYSQINNRKLDTSVVSKEKGGFGKVEKSVDSLTDSINTKTDAIKTEANTMELAARAEVKSIGKIIESVNQLIERIKSISDIKPKINLSDTIQSDKSNISSENTIPQAVNQQEQLREAVLDTATAYEKMTEAEKEARKSAIQTAVNSIPQAENTARYVHWGNIDQSKSILSNPNGMSTGDYGLISSFADCLGEAETSMEAIYKYWESLHAEGFDKGSALVIDIPLDEVKEFERGLKDNIPQEYIKGFVDTESNAITLNTTLQNGLKETAEQAEKTAQSVQDISKTQIKDVFQEDKIDQAATSAKELDKTLEQVNIPTDSFDEVLSKLDLAKSELGEIVKITKQSVSDSEGKFHDSYTLKDKRGSTEIYGLSSNTEKGQLLRSNIVQYDYKNAEQDAKALLEVERQLTKEAEQQTSAQQKKWKAFQQEQENYEKSVNNVNSAISKTDELLNKLPLHEKLDSQFIGLLNSVDELNSKLKAGKISVSEYNKSVKSLTSEYSKLVTIQQNRDVETYKQNAKAAEQEAKAVKRLNDELEGYNNQIPKKPIDGQRSDYFEGFVQNYKNAIAEAQKYLDTLGDNPITKEVKEEWERLIDVIKKAKKEMDAVPNAARGSDALSRGKEIDTITKYLNKFTGISKQAKQELNGLLKQLQSGDPSVNVKKIHERFLELTIAEREAGREARNLFDVFKDKKIYSFLGQAASMFSFYDAINGIRQCVTTVRELDTALTEMRKVSDEGLNSLKDYQNISFDVADEIGSTALALQNATATWMRLGESLSEASESAKDATILMNVSEFESIDEATDSLVSMSQAFKELDKMEIIDVLDKIGNEYSISTDNLSRALQDSAAVLKTQGNDLYESVALLTAGNAINQDYSKTAGGVRTISLRLAGTEEAKEELSSLGEDVDDFIVQTNSKTQELIKDYTAVASNAYKGIDVLDANGNLRNTYNILLDISKIYKEIQEEDKKAGTNRAQALVEYIAGKNRSNIASSILLNPELLESVYESAKNADGAAMKELDAYMESLDAKVAQFQNRLQELESDLVNSDFLKGAIDFGTEFIHILDEIINKFGVLPTIMAGVGAGLGIQNLGKTYKCTVFKLNCFEYALYA